MAKLLTDYKNIVTASGKSYKQVIAKSDGRVLWKAGTIGAIVTYIVDTASFYTEEVSTGESVLNPTAFTPTKDGWTFIGWREDTVASGDVLSSKVMEDEPITLYAVFDKEVTLTYYDNTPTPIASTKTRYYNNGNYLNPWYTLEQSAKDGWSTRGWGTDTAANASVVFPVTLDRYIEEDITIYGLYEITITETFVDYNGAGVYIPVHSTAYYNSSGNIKYSEITAPDGGSWNDGLIYEGWIFQGWGYPNNGGFDVNVAPGQSWTSTDFCVRSAIYAKTVTLSYDGAFYGWADAGNVIMSAQTGTAYYNIWSGDRSYPTFNLKANEFVRPDYIFAGWDLGAAGATVTLDSDRTAYAQWTRMESTPFFLYADNLSHGFVLEDHGTGEALVPTVDYSYWLVVCTHGGENHFSCVTHEIRGIAKNHCREIDFNCYIADAEATIKISGANTGTSVTYTITVGIENIFDISSIEDDVINIELSTGYDDVDHSVQISRPFFI